jgi:hypothetical protein
MRECSAPAAGTKKKEKKKATPLPPASIKKNIINDTQMLTLSHSHTHTHTRIYLSLSLNHLNGASTAMTVEILPKIDTTPAKKHAEETHIS